MSDEIIFASHIDLPDGRRIWIPPTGNPYWVTLSGAGKDLTVEEIEKYLGGRRNQ